MPNIIFLKPHLPIKARLHDATKTCDVRQKHATCDKIALFKRAYLCDMRLLHAVAGKLKSFAIFSHVVYFCRIRSCKRALILQETMFTTRKELWLNVQVGHLVRYGQLLNIADGCYWFVSVCFFIMGSGLQMLCTF